MNKFFATFSLLIVLVSCSNSHDMETGEIRTLQLIKTAFDNSNQSKLFIDARNLINRAQIDAANIPVLFVELASGQNGTLTPYPGQGIGQTWLGVDGATITLKEGILKASRGMGDDLMGSSSSMPPWPQIIYKTESYRRELYHITGNNKISKRVLSCDTQRISSGEVIEIWGINFKVARFEENCLSANLKIKNTYYVDNQGTIRKSSQYHSDTIGSIVIERLDR